MILETLAVPTRALPTYARPAFSLPGFIDALPVDGVVFYSAVVSTPQAACVASRPKENAVCYRATATAVAVLF